MIQINPHNEGVPPANRLNRRLQPRVTERGLKFPLSHRGLATRDVNPVEEPRNGDIPDKSSSRTQIQPFPRSV